MVNRHCTKHDLPDEHFQRAAYLLLRQGAMTQFHCNDCEYRFLMALSQMTFRKAAALAGYRDRAVDAAMDMVTEVESKPIRDYKRKHKNPEPPQ